MQLTDSKSLLAKLLAEENLTVQHRKTQTAYFDVKQRILVCPILKDMPAELYDLLMGHEVGHALYTPAQGWHDALAKDVLPGFKTFLNVVEDARIERKVKDKFPGLRPSFYRGYRNLSERDFFGLSKIANIQTLPLIDRINLHFKLGTLCAVTFSEDEQVYVDRVASTETWEDVVEIAQELYQYAKEEKPQLDGSDELSLDSLEQLNLDDFDSTETGEEGEENESVENFYEVVNTDKLDPESITDKAFRQKEHELVDETCIPIAYVTLPKFNMEGRIISAEKVHNNIAAYLQVRKENGSSASFTDPLKFFNVSLRGFMEKNNRYINFMVKEFELRKNAKQFARASVNKTGELDMKKIAGYKLTEDLFRRVTIVPQGKNHGLLMFLDLSGSMTDNMKGTIEQILICTTFCRKVNIPFSVYGFSDLAWDYDKQSAGLLETQLSVPTPGSFAVIHNTFHLKNYISSTMSRNEYNNAMLNMLLLGEMFKRGYIDHVPLSERLSGTPLNEAVVASIDITRNFKAKNRLEVVTTMFLTDGEGTSRFNVVYDNDLSIRTISNNLGAYHFNIHITDPVTKQAVTIERGNNITKALVELARKSSGANYINFYLTDGSKPYISAIKHAHREYSLELPQNFELEMSKARKEKYFTMANTGFNSFFIVPGGDSLEVSDTGIDVPVMASKNEIRKAFMKTVSSRAVNRVFLSRFCNTLCSTL